MTTNKEAQATFSDEEGEEDEKGDDGDEEKEDPPHKVGLVNINIFVANIVLINITRMAIRMYLGGSIRTIERRFGLRSASSGLIFGFFDVGHIALVLFLGYCARTAHRPRLIGILSVFPGLCGLLMALPHFILPEADPVLPSTIGNQSVRGLFEEAAVTLCDGTVHEEDCAQEMEVAAQNTIAYGIFALAGLLAGVGGPATMVLGVPYVDSNASSTKVAFSVGLVVSSFALGPVVGLLLASLCTSLPEDLQATNMQPSDPNFIGAWWLGFLLLGIATLLLALPMFLYPRHMTARAAAAAASYGRAHHREADFSIWRKTKSFLRSLAQVLSNKAFVVIVMSDYFTLLMLIGAIFNVPRYLEVHFLAPAYQANIVAAISTAFMGLLGGVLGGLITSRLKLKIRGLAKMLSTCNGIAVVCIFVLVSLRCPKVQLDGEGIPGTETFSLETSCNRNCTCLTNKEAYMPVCGANDVTYFSPCHAGCSQATNGSLYDCSCIEQGTAELGLCLGTCDLFLLFSVIVAIGCLVGNGGRSSQILATLRVLPEADRPLGLGINSFVINLFAMLPGSVIFGYLIDTSCDMWQTTCGETGSCLLYDADKFRWRTGGPAAGFMAVSFLMTLAFLFIVSRNRNTYEPRTVEMTMDVNGTDAEKKLFGIDQDVAIGNNNVYRPNGVPTEESKS